MSAGRIKRSYPVKTNKAQELSGKIAKANEETAKRIDGLVLRVVNLEISQKEQDKAFGGGLGNHGAEIDHLRKRLDEAENQFPAFHAEMEEQKTTTGQAVQILRGETDRALKAAHGTRRIELYVLIVWLIALTIRAFL